MRRWAPVSHLIAMVLLLQVVLAPVHCLAMAAQPAGLQVVLCSPAGTERTIHVGPNGEEVPAPDTGKGFCIVCGALPHVTLPEPPALPTPAWVAHAPGWRIALAETLPPGARGPPYRPTGPPALS